MPSAIGGAVSQASAARLWSPTLDPDFAARASAVAWSVAQRLRDREGLLAVQQAALQQTFYPSSVRWAPLGVAQGDAGLALCCAYLDVCFPDEDWDALGHRYLSLAVRAAEALAPAPLGIFGGLAGLAFAAHCLSRGGTRYAGLSNSLDASLSAAACAAANAMAGVHGMAVSDFDLITGLSGVGAYFLCRHQQADAAAGLREVLKALAASTATVDGIPHWYTPPEALADPSMLSLHPNGNLNCGLAHGIAGPIALMALALQEGFEVDGQREALARSAGWLARHRTADEFGINWPTAVPCFPGGVAPPASLDASRAAWCYGTPGVARSLWLAGQALGDDALRALAIEGMAAVYRRPIARRQIDSPTFCHGVAGLLHITLRFAHDSGEPLFTDAAHQLGRQLLQLHDAQRPLGFAAIEPQGNLVDLAGLLDGAPGVMLTLLAAAHPAPPNWDRLFLLS